MPVNQHLIDVLHEAQYIPWGTFKSGDKVIKTARHVMDNHERKGVPLKDLTGTLLDVLKHGDRVGHVHNGDGIVNVDFDMYKLAPQNGHVDPARELANLVLAHKQTYIERGVREEGSYHIWGRVNQATLDRIGARKVALHGFIDILADNCFSTITGRVYRDAPVADISDLVNHILDTAPEGVTEVIANDAETQALLDQYAREAKPQLQRFALLAEVAKIAPRFMERVSTPMQYVEKSAANPKPPRWYREFSSLLEDLIRVGATRENAAALIASSEFGMLSYPPNSDNGVRKDKIYRLMLENVGDVKRNFWDRSVLSYMRKRERANSDAGQAARSMTIPSSGKILDGEVIPPAPLAPSPPVIVIVDGVAFTSIAAIVDAVRPMTNNQSLAVAKAKEYIRACAVFDPAPSDFQALVDLLKSKHSALNMTEKEIRLVYTQARAEIVKVQFEDSPHDPSKWLAWCREKYRIIRNYGGKTVVIPKNRSSDMAVMPPMAKKAFEEANLERKVFTGVSADGEPVFKKVHTWYLDHLNADRYETQVFKPTHKDSQPDEYNVWRGWPWERAPEQWQYVANDDGTLRAANGDDATTLWPRIHDYLFKVVCSSNQEHYTYLLGWFADWVQNPLKYNTTVVGIRGGMGTGKTKLLELVKSLVGTDYSTIFTNPDVLGKNFNALMLYKLFLGFDEAFAVADKKAEAVFKNLVTGEVFTVEKKFLDAFEARKFFRMVFASNEEWFMSADFGDRRQFLLTCSDVRKKDAAYFAALDSALCINATEAGGTCEMPAFFEYLQRVSLAGFDLQKIPQTSTLMEQKVRSLRGDHRTMHSILEAGLLPFATGGAVKMAARSFDATQPIELYVDAHFVETQQFYEMLMNAGFDFRMDIAKAGKLLSMIGAGGSHAEDDQPLTPDGSLNRTQKWDGNARRNMTGRWISPLWLSRSLAAKGLGVAQLQWDNKNADWVNFRRE